MNILSLNQVGLSLESNNKNWGTLDSIFFSLEKKIKIDRIEKFYEKVTFVRKGA